MTNPNIEQGSDEKALFFSNGKEAVAAINEGGGLNVDYMDFYHMLRNGGVPGAYQQGKFWRVPVSGLRKLGYNPSTKDTIQLARGVSFEEEDQEPLRPLKDSTPPSSPYTKRENEIRDKEQLTLEFLLLLEKENEDLKAKLEATEDKLEVAESHLRDLRSILDYATKPSTGE